MKRLSILAVAALAAAVAIPGGSSSAAETAATRHLEGTVLSVNRDDRTFRLKDHESGTFRIKVTSSTNYERISGFSAVKAGKKLEATVRRSNGRWVATRVETSGGGGGGGNGGGGGGNDDGPNHT